MTDEPAPTPRQLQLMAWLDGELPAAERARFERQLADDPEFAAEAAAQKNLMDLTRSLAGVEPTENEIRRFWSGFYNRTEWRLGWILLGLGVVGLVAEGIHLLIVAGWVSWPAKAAALCAMVGGALLIWNTARLKMRTSRFDRYRGVMR